MDPALPLQPHHRDEWVTGSAVAPELAAANLQTIAGPEVLEALAGERLAQLGAHAQQYATQAVARLLRPLEPVAAAGGWWCSGLDPLADWAAMAWGCFRPDAPRWDQEKGRPRKYEHPIGTPARTFWLRVPAADAQLVARRHDLALPAEVVADADGSRGAFWRWWAATPALPLVVTEGSKKAAALLSVGIPAVALPGIWNGCPKGADDRPALHPDLAAVPLGGRQVAVLFDASDRRNPDEPKAARRLGRLLQKAGAMVRVGIVPGSHSTGADDHLAAGGSWEQLAAALAPLSPGPVLPRWRRADRIAPAGADVGQTCPLPPPDQARLVCLQSAMGSGKTKAIAAALAPLLADGVPVLVVTHRRSLGAALAKDLGLPWGDAAAPGSDLRQQGLALCIDSLCPDSGLRITASDWAGAVVVLDEAAQVLAHGLTGTGTAIGGRRPAVLETLAGLLEGAAQVIAADAQLSAPVVAALEAMTGHTAQVIGSEHRPAAGRQLVAHTTRDTIRAQLVGHLQQRQRLWIATTAQQAGSANSAQNLARLALQHWPTARVLVVDSQTVAEPGHAAACLADQPNAIAAAHDVVIASPAVAAGLSVTLRDHFAAVLVFAGGTTDPESVAQAAARVRDNCPRHLFAPERSPGAHLRTGSGATHPAELLRHLEQHEAATVAQLLVAGGWAPEGNSGGPWLRLWAELCSTRNGQRHAYRATVLALLEREGYSITTAADPDADALLVAKVARRDLAAIAAEAQAAEDAATIAAAPLTDQEAAVLQRKTRRTPTERAQLARWRISRAWGLGDGPPTPELLAADREGMSQRLRFGWCLRSIDARQLVAGHDVAMARELAPDGRAWAPDLTREAIGPKLTAADALGLAAWLERREWFTATDPQLVSLHTTATMHTASLRQVLGVSPGVRATTTLRQLLALAGHRLEAHRCRVDGERAWRYRVVPEDLPPGADAPQLEVAWCEQLGRGCPKTLPTDKGGTVAVEQEGIR